jgi:glycosyltransferase involved in cell wall biosynthesis
LGNREDSGLLISQLRVLNIIGSLRVGGAERYVSRVAPLLRMHGIEVEICALEKTGPLVAETEAAGIAVFGTRMILRPRHLQPPQAISVVLQAISDIRRLVQKRRYDVVHTYMFHADVIGTVAAKLASCPRIIVSRRALHQGRHRPAAYEHWLELGTNIVAHELIANSQAVLRDVERHERILPRHRGVIYNGIDIARYQVAGVGRTTGAIRLITVGSLTEPKGQEFVVQALALLRVGGVNAELLLVGAGPEEHKLKAVARSVDVADRVKFAGEQLDPRRFLEASDIFVLPSRQEGFSNALIEAMASGLPVVATDVGGNREALGEVGGRIVPPLDPVALAEAIKELASSRSSLASIGNLNRERVARLFSLDASVRRLADWYRNGPSPSS